MKIRAYGLDPVSGQVLNGQVVAVLSDVDDPAQAVAEFVSWDWGEDGPRLDPSNPKMALRGTLSFRATRS